MKNNETHVSVLTPLLIAMSVCLAILKLANIISISWWLVSVPILILLGIWLLVIIVMLIANLISAIRWCRRRRR